MTLTLTAPCQKEELKNLRDKFSAALTESGVTGLLRDQIILAVDEACANAIIHGNDCDVNQTIRLEANIVVSEKDRTLTVKVFDVGEFEIKDSMLNRDIQYLVKNRIQGGLGLRLIHTIMDEVSFHDSEGVYICTMTKVIPLADQPAPSAAESDVHSS